MAEKKRVLALKTGFWFGRAWLIDENGERCSGKFRVISKQSCGPITALNTSGGAILYSRYNPEYKLECCAVWEELVKLAENVYMVCLKKPVFSPGYFLYDGKLNPILKEPVHIDQVQPLTRSLLAIKSFNDWGIVDITTGKMVCEPEYQDIVFKGGKLIGKKRDVKVTITETEISV